MGTAEGEGIAFGAVASTAADVASSSSRKYKSERLAELLKATPAEEAPIVVGFLTGQIRQGRIGIGWATMSDLDFEPAQSPSLTVAEIDAAVEEVASITGAGSVGERRAILGSVLARATAAEAGLLRDVLTGGLRQGALDGVMADAIAKAHGVPATLVRRAAMLSGDLGSVGELAASGGRAALEKVGLSVLRPVQPMLAATAASVSEAMDEVGPAVVQAKLDGIRLQVHRRGHEVRLFTRNLHDVTERFPAIVELVRSFPASELVLDGEVIGLFADSPEMFQDTASAFSSGVEDRAELSIQFFDILHRDGQDLIDEPLSFRLDALVDVVGSLAIRAITPADVDEAETFAAETLEAGHEGVMVKALGSKYAAGRRGKTWRKVKPVYSFDLVVLGAEWGHGRRTGWLSNLHLGARGGDDFVMVGKTFKGLTDELLTWQTAELLEREERREGITVFVRRELVVEVAIDGVQRSTTYPGGLALRFARVKRYRPDKSPAEADTIEALREFL